jgi:lipopolysaccharide/colanic/teichoic acid biosynthesis glycosyltransferase
MPLITDRYKPFKRVMDIVGAIFGLIILSPVFIVIAIWVRRDSAGPILYKQTRVTKGGKLFQAIKFRSMRVASGNAANDGITTPDKQDRITKSGAFIRKYRLDELTQLWNVLVGEMSLVGPRPQTPKYVEIHAQTYAIINTIRPGITGLASIKFHEREERMLVAAGDKADDIYIHKILPMKFKYNLFYVHNYGLWFDIKIIWWTITGMVNKARR